MSKIGQITDNRPFNPIITNIPYLKLKDFQDNNKSINIPNAFIISVPQNDNEEDIQGEASIWVSDGDGYLLNITKPINV